MNITDEALLKELSNKTGREYEEFLKKNYNKYPDQEELIKINMKAFQMWKEMIPYG